MAKKDKKEKKTKKDKKSKNANSGKLSFKARLLMVFVLMVGLVFLPTSMLLFFGMIPSMVAFFVSGRGYGARASTISAMNLAGCIPFVFKLWSMENDFEASFKIITNMNYMSIIYVSALFGYLIDWVMTGLMSSFLYQKGMNRMKAIKKRQELLIEQWGKGVTGVVENDAGEEEKVDEYGF